jgi:uncharacterized membrane protein
MAGARNASSATAENIETVIRLEEEDERETTLLERVPHVIGSFVGTLYIVAFQCVSIAAWIVANNIGAVSFDHYPYPLLSIVLGVEAVVLSSFVLISQNRMDLIARRRNHLDLPINLLAEKETTKLLQLVQALNAHLKVPGDGINDDKELTEETAIDDLVKQLKEKEADSQT